MAIDWNLFCHHDRRELIEPIMWDGKVWASDGIIAICADAIHAPDGLTVVEDRPMAASKTAWSMFPEGACFNTWLVDGAEEIPFPPIVDCADCEGLGKKLVCRRCNGVGDMDDGTGYLETCDQCMGGYFSRDDWENMSPSRRARLIEEETCDQCGGTGRQQDRETSFRRDTWPERLYLGAYFAALMATLPRPVRLETATWQYLKPLSFVFNGGKGMIMPRRDDR